MLAMPLPLRTNAPRAAGFDAALITGALKEYFDACDNDHDGRIGYDGFLQLLKYLGASRDLASRRTPFQHIDIKDHQSIDIFDFISWWME
jgi:Ca2+-binding EF-hand superfamily protein